MKIKSPRKKSRGQKKSKQSPSLPLSQSEPILSSPVPYIPSNAKFSQNVDISDNNKFVITGTVSERELRDAYLEWCMRRHGSEVIVSKLIGVSRKSVYNHIKRINKR